MLLSEESNLLLFVGSDTKIADVFGHVHAVPVFVKWHNTGEISKWHTVSVLGWGRGWGVGIDVSINPNDFTLWGKLLHTGDRADSLGVISSKDDWVVTFPESFVSLVSELSGRSDNVLDVLGISKLFFVEDFASGESFLDLIEVAIWA